MTNLPPPRVIQTDERGMQHKSKYEYLYIDIAVYDQTTAWPHAKVSCGRCLVRGEGKMGAGGRDT